jgi:hypothetical protein
MSKSESNELLQMHKAKQNNRLYKKQNPIDIAKTVPVPAAVTAEEK